MNAAKRSGGNRVLKATRTRSRSHEKTKRNARNACAHVSSRAAAERDVLISSISVMSEDAPALASEDDASACDALLSNAPTNTRPSA